MMKNFVPKFFFIFKVFGAKKTKSNKNSSFLINSNSSKFNGKLEIGNNSAAEFDTKFINIARLFMKSDPLKSFTGFR